MQLYNLIEKPKSEPFLVYLALVLPMFLVLLFSGIGMYILFQFKAKQAQTQAQYTAELAHEIRTPLTNIRLYIELMKRESNSSNSRNAQILVAEIERLSLLVDNAITFAQPSAKQAKCNEKMINVRGTNSEHTDIDALILDIMETMTPIFTENQCQVKCDLGIDEVQAINKDALQRILINLLDNCHKYANEGPVLIRSRMSEKLIIIEVIDSGSGITQSLWQHIQSQDLKRIQDSKKGFGLGLNVCLKLVCQLNGTLALLPTKKGAHFRIVIPKSWHKETSI